MTEAEAPDGGPRKVGRLEVRRLIAEGGMGAVFEAYDPAVHRSVAVKRMRPEFKQDPKGRGLFLEEARIVAALRHPNIVEILGVVEEAGEI